MIKDYAKQPTDNGKPRRKKTLLTLLIITLAIAVPALMFYVKLQKTRHLNKNAAPTARAAAPKETEKNTTDFDFYTLLPKTDTPK